MSAIKISFEIDYSWNIRGFRNLIKTLLSNEAEYDIYIISNHDSSDAIYKAASLLALDSSRTIVCNFTDDKLQAIIDNGIQIHLDCLQSFVELVDTETDAVGVLVNTNFNGVYPTMSEYIIDLNTAIAYIREGYNEP